MNVFLVIFNKTLQNIAITLSIHDVHLRPNEQIQSKLLKRPPLRDDHLLITTTLRSHQANFSTNFTVQNDHLSNAINNQVLAVPN